MFVGVDGRMYIEVGMCMYVGGGGAYVWGEMVEE